MRPFQGALGLRAYERLEIEGDRTILRWCAPLDRASAALCRRRLEREQRIARHGVEALHLSASNASICYLLGAGFASLRRVLIVEAGGSDQNDAEKNARSLIHSLGLDPIGALPDEAMIARHAAGLAIARRDPRRFSSLFFEAESWPPSGEEAPRHFEIEADLTLFDRTALQKPLVHLRNGAEATARALSHGVIARRWRLLGDNTLRPGISNEDDLRSGGAAFAFAKIITSELAGGRWDPSYEYAMIIDAKQLARADRFVLPGDRYGAFHALSEAISEAELREALAGGSLPSLHEVLFFDEIPAKAFTRVLCRTQKHTEDLRLLVENPTIVG